jgi:xylulokinase
LLCSLADAIDHLSATIDTAPRRILLVGGAASNPAVRALAPAIFGQPVTVPAPGEYVALGAARQAAWALAGTAEPPSWAPIESETFEAEPTPLVREAYALLRDDQERHR